MKLTKIIRLYDNILSVDVINVGSHQIGAELWYFIRTYHTNINSVGLNKPVEELWSQNYDEWLDDINLLWQLTDVQPKHLN